MKEPLRGPRDAWHRTSRTTIPSSNRSLMRWRRMKKCVFKWSCRKYNACFRKKETERKKLAAQAAFFQPKPESSREKNPFTQSAPASSQSNNSEAGNQQQLKLKDYMGLWADDGEKSRAVDRAIAEMIAVQLWLLPPLICNWVINVLSWISISISNFDFSMIFGISISISITIF